MKVEETDNFKSFWAVWPKKVSKADALKAWHSMGCEQITATILKAVQDQKRVTWKNSERKFIPMPATWLRSGRWEDEIYVPESAPDPLIVKKEFDSGPDLPQYGAAVNRIMFTYVANRIMKGGKTISDEQVKEMIGIKERFRQALVKEWPDPAKSKVYLERLYGLWDEVL